MREHTREASRRRDEGLARIRKITFWVTGGAAAVSLGLGTAFAHELPGHARAASSTGSSATVGGSPRTAGSPAQSGASGRAASSGARTSSRHHQQALVKPKQAPQQPASSPAAPPAVSSGGS